MKFLGFPHHKSFILMLLGPLFNQTTYLGRQMTIAEIQVLYGYPYPVLIVTHMEMWRIMFIKIRADGKR